MLGVEDGDRRGLHEFCARLRTALEASRVRVTLAPGATVVADTEAGGGASRGRAARSVPIAHGADRLGELQWWSSGAATARDTWLASAAADLLAPWLASLGVAPAPPHDAAYGLVGVSDAIDELRAAIPAAAAAPFSVLIEGESGVGKELVARAVHAASRRRGAFVAVNCAALPDELVDAELFGHVRGAFTGAGLERRGLFEAAHAGTFFLDEVAELSPRAQAKLLRVLQEGEVRRLGENAARRIDVRLVAATNRPLAGEVAAGRFRADLRYRLDVVRLCVPPLRERREDIAVLAEHFWAVLARHTGSRARLAPSLLQALAAADWPGNARELQNTVASLAVRAPIRGLVEAGALGPTWAATSPAPSLPLDTARRLFEAAHVRAVLARCGYRPGMAARELGLSRQGLAKLMRRLGLRLEPPPGPLRQAM